MSTKILGVLGLGTVIVLSATWTGWKLYGHRPIRPVAGAFHRSNADASGHSRGIVQVDLMRRIMVDKARSAVPAKPPANTVERLVPTQEHPLAGHRAPGFVLENALGKTWNLGTENRFGPVVVVFYLGATCVACITHLVELDATVPRFRERGARVVAISGDTPEFSRDRSRKFGGFEIPLLSDVGHAVSQSYGVWKTVQGGDQNDGTALHGTFIIDGDGLVRWAYVGDRPFADIEVLLAEIDRLSSLASTKSPTVSHLSK